MMAKKWKTARLIVEVPFQGLHIGEKDFRWAVEILLTHALHHKVNKHRNPETLIHTGQIRVKVASKVEATKKDPQ
jgi:hypothetical protein